MKIRACEKAENCFDGEFIFQYYFDTHWTKEYIMMLEELGSLRYYESFPRPMFQLNCADGTIIKGLENAKECKAIFPRSNPAVARENFEKRLQLLMKGGVCNG